MPLLFDRLVANLFGGEQTATDASERQLIVDLIETVVETVEPRLRYQPRYVARLEGALGRTVAHLRAIARERLEPVLLARAQWSDDPRLNAFFATADDIPACLGRSRELREFFAAPDNTDAREAYALLGMKKVERTVFAPRLEGSLLRQDVSQATVSFSDHRLVAPMPTLVATRREIGRRIIQRLAQVALSRVIDLDTRAIRLRQRKAYLERQLRLLNLARDGLEGVVSDPAARAEKIRAVEDELRDAARGYGETKTSLTTLDRYLVQIDDVFSHPERHVALTHSPLRLNRMGFKADAAATERVNELVLAELSVGENLQAAIAIVRCPRGEMPPGEDLLAKAKYYL